MEDNIMEKQVYGIIYYFRNKINGKMYFGQTIHTFEDRYHKDDSKIINGVCNDYFRKSIEKYGIENLILHIQKKNWML